MIEAIVSKLPFIDKQKTIDFYKALDFSVASDFGDYLIVRYGQLEIHFFFFPSLEPAKSDFMIYLRVDDLDVMHQSVQQKLPIHPNGKLETKSWGQREFSLIDPNGTLLTFGQSV